MTTEQQLMRTLPGIRDLSLLWFGVIPDTISTILIWNNWRRRKESPATISTGTLIWLKTRLMELGLLTVPHVDPPEICIPVTLHFFALCDQDPDYKPCEPNYARSRWATSLLTTRTPIDRIAQRVTGIVDETYCRHCGRYFRNSAAHRLHLVEKHHGP